MRFRESPEEIREEMRTREEQLGRPLTTEEIVAFNTEEARRMVQEAKDLKAAKKEERVKKVYIGGGAFGGAGPSDAGGDIFRYVIILIIIAVVLGLLFSI